MNAELLFGVAGAAGLGAGVALLAEDEGPRARIVASLVALTMGAGGAALVDGRAIAAVGAATLALALGGVRDDRLAVAFASPFVIVAAWAAPAIALAALVALAWVLGRSRDGWIGWIALAALACALPERWGFPPAPVRVLLFALAGGLAFAARRGVADAIAGPAAKRAVLTLLSALPAIALLALPLLFERAFTMPRDALWQALLVGLLAVAGAAAFAISGLGLLLVASTRNGLKLPLAGLAAALLLGLPLVGLASLTLAAPPVALGAGVGAVFLWSRAHGRGAARAAPAG